MGNLALERLISGLQNGLLVVVDRDRFPVHGHNQAAQFLEGFVRQPCGSSVPHHSGHDGVDDGQELQVVREGVQ